MEKTNKKARLKTILQDVKELKRLHKKRLPNPVMPDPITEKLADWLGRLKLLHGVPFNYLVPDVNMLPLESIRFFYCDMVWLDYLVEGALSLGRSTAGDQAHDTAFNGELHEQSKYKLKAQRLKIFGHLNNHISAQEKISLKDSSLSPTEKVSGFLLRSGVVKGWSGLKVEAYTDNEQTRPCQLLRMEQLSPTILLCLFDGPAQNFRIHEHPEVLHFGFDVSTTIPPVYSKSYRYPVDSGSNKAGSTFTGATPPSIQLSRYQRKAAGTVQINKLALAIQASLGSDPIKYNGHFTSAEFALEMAEGVESVNFTFNQTS